MMQKIIPVKESGVDRIYEKKLIYLDEKTSLTPSIAVINAHLEIYRMGKIAIGNLALALESFNERDIEKAKKTLENEVIVDFLNHSIASKLVWINNMALSGYEAEKIGKMFQTLSDIERIGDHAENIAEYTISVKENELKFSDAAITEIKELGKLTLNLTKKALETYIQEDDSKLATINSMEQEIDRISIEFTENHTNRLKVASCEPKSGIIFTDMIIDLERSADHANNIAFSILPGGKASKSEFINQ
jgi:phosphate:Na+ symporter